LTYEIGEFLYNASNCQKEDRRKKEETTGQFIMVCPIPYGDHKKIEEDRRRNQRAKI